MTETMFYGAQKINMKQLEAVYERRLNSMADTFLNLINNLENNNLFRDLQRASLIQHLSQTKLGSIKKTLSTYRMEYLKSVIQGMLEQNQQNTIKYLQLENAALKTQKQYLIRIVESHSLQMGPENNEISSQMYEDNEELQHQHMSVLDDHQHLNQYRQNQKQSKRNLQHISIFQNAPVSKIRETESKSRNCKLQPKMKSSTDQRVEHRKSSQQFFGHQPYTRSQATSFIIGLKQNGAADQSNNCISSIEQVSSNSSSQKRCTQTNPNRTKKQKNSSEDDILMVSLRQQLQNLQMTQKYTSGRKAQGIRRKNLMKGQTIDYENEQNMEPTGYQFKYLKF